MIKNIQPTMIIALLLGFLIQSLTSCRKAVIGRGQIISETRDIPSFTGIDLSADFTVQFVPSSHSRVTIQAQENILALTKIEVRQGILRLGYLPGTQILRHEPVMIRVEGPLSQSFTLSGSGSLYCSDSLSSSSLSMKVSGSGSIVLQHFDGNFTSSDISGSGSINILSGKSTQLHSAISGSGTANFFLLQAEQVQTNTSGSGDTEVWAEKTLHATISGSGDVYYQGQASVQSQISGSGHVIKR